MSGRVGLACLAGLLAFSSAQPAAHEIPASVVVQAFARPEGQRLRLLLRVPLVSMRDFNFPSRPGILDSPMLDIAAVQPMLEEAVRLWLVPAVPMFEEESALDPPVVASARLALPSDRSFETYEQALAHLSDPPLSADSQVATSAALLDVMLEYRISSDRARFSIDPKLARLGLRVLTSFRFMGPGAPERAFQFAGDPGLVRLDPSWLQAALTFVRLGFEHILDGLDHLLFLFCLVLPLRRFWQLAGVVTAFTVAHSITLFFSAFGLAPDALWFPPLVETLIAASIVYMALENIVVGARAGAGAAIAGTAVSGRWMIAFAFGLVHGFGFSFALSDTLKYAGAHLVTSLLSFNVGVELGQLLVLVLLIPLLALAFRFAIEERLGVIIASALVTHTAWHWMTDRGAVLWQYDWSLTDPATLAFLLRAMMIVVAMAGVMWIVKARRRP
jgi:hypothetical protein